MSYMKKTAAILAAICVAAGMCACNDDKNQNVPMPTPEVSVQQNVEEKPAEVIKNKQEAEDIEALAGEALEKMAKVPEYPEGYPTLEDVVAQYEKANAAIGWIVRTESVVTYPDDNFWYEGVQYQRVRPDCYLGKEVLLDGTDEDKGADMLIYNLETLEAYFATLIHPEEASDYIGDIENDFTLPRFIERDGKLYAISIAFPASGYRDEDVYELVLNDDGNYTFSVKYATLDENGDVYKEFTEDFGYENVDGRWVFTNFRVIKQH